MTVKMMNPKQLLAIPALYSLFRKFVGSDATRRYYADHFIRAKAGEKVLDIGCGTGDILNFLPAVDYVGFDISAEYIELARKRFGGKGKFYCEPVGDNINAPAASFDLVLAHGVLHHLSDDEVRSLLGISRDALKQGGRLMTFDGCFTEDQSALARYLVSKDRGRFVRTREAYERLARSVFGEVNVTVRHDLIRIPYTHIIMECVR